jgi:hypothetical protein
MGFLALDARPSRMVGAWDDMVGVYLNFQIWGVKGIVGALFFRGDSTTY